MIQTCEMHVAALLNRGLMRTSGIKFGDINERCRTRTNWEVINIDLVTLQRLLPPGNGDWLALTMVTVMNSDVSDVCILPAARLVSATVRQCLCRRDQMLMINNSSNEGCGGKHRKVFIVEPFHRLLFLTKGCLADKNKRVSEPVRLALMLAKRRKGSKICQNDENKCFSSFTIISVDASLVFVFFCLCMFRLMRGQLIKVMQTAS